jgi:hypothetical protein
MVYISSYVDGIRGVETLNGFTDDTIDYFEAIYEKYNALTGHDLFNESTASEGYFWGDLDISSESIQGVDDSFEALLKIYYRIDDFYGDGDDLSTYDLYSLTFNLNKDNKFNLTETSSYENFDNNVDLFDGTSAFFNLGYSDEEVKSFNLKTGEFKTESLLNKNISSYQIDDEENDHEISLSTVQQTNNYGLLATFRNEVDDKASQIIVQNIDNDNHSVLLEIEPESKDYIYFDDITENKMVL